MAAPPTDAMPDEKSDILIVDDIPDKLLAFASVLEELGQNLVTVRSGRDALREVLLREYAVILLDVNMPDIDGFETAAMIRQHRRSRHTPIIFITAYPDEMQIARGYRLGAVDYILSPVVPEVLRSKVRVFVELHRMQRSLRKQADERVALAQALAAQRLAEDNERRSAFLLAASRQLAHSLDLAVGARSLLEMMVPGMGCLAVLLLDSGDGRRIALRTAAGTAAQPISEQELPPALHATLQRAIDGQRRIALSPGEAASLDAAALGLPSATQLGAAVAVPLLKGDVASGVLFVAADASRIDEQTRDWLALDSLCARAALAFDNARLYASLQDEIARRSAAQEELQAANRRKDEFLAMLSHELRNPLASIRSSVAVMRRIAPPDAKLAWAIDVSDRQTQHLARLVDDLLDVARISQGKIELNRERVDLNAVIAHAAETSQPLFESRCQQLQLRKWPTPVWLTGDFARLSQVVSNLLNNASKYSDDGSRVELSLSVADGQARLTVRDEGDGIDPDLMPHIFDLFTQGARSLDRGQGGLGVGLTLVRRLAELHGGRVTASSAGIGQGSQFDVTLPCVELVNASSSAERPEEGAPGVPGKRILIVDDNADVAEPVAAFLQLEGHEVKCVRDSAAALACLPVFLPQVALLDLGLPVIDGYEVARRMRALPFMRDALIVAVSGYAQPEDKRRAREAGFDAHFTKPADLRRLVEEIQEWRRRGSASQTANLNSSSA